MSGKLTISWVWGKILLGLLALSLCVSSVEARPENPKRHKAGDFAYYTLVLSWSPTYCDSRQGRRDTQQCGPRKRYAFVVHGLWPQYERGWPSYCRVPRGEYWLSRSLIQSMLDIMPSPRLVIHEWKKHGTCSGLGKKGYFALTRKLFRKVTIPPRYVRPNATIFTSPEALKKDFLAANGWLSADMITVHCGNRRDRARLRELRLCFTREGNPRACGPNERRSCRARVLVLPPVR